MRALVAFVVCLVAAAPLRADPPPTAPVETRRGPCIAGPFILVRTAQPHVDGLKSQVKSFLADASGNAGVAEGGYTVFALKQPKYGLRWLAFMPDALGGVIMARAACEDHIAVNDAEVVDYMAQLHARIVGMRWIVTNVELIDFTQALEEKKPSERGPP